MTKAPVLDLILNNKKAGKKSWAILIDPDKTSQKLLDVIISKSEQCGVDFLMVGGSLITTQSLNATLNYLKSNTKLPIVLFPGSNMHIDEQADAILFLSLLSGRNPEFLIGQQVVAAPKLKDSSLEILSTAYILIDGGKQTTVSYISNTTPIPNYKPEIAASTALAGQLMGMRLTYLDSGSGADEPVPAPLIKMVSEWVSTPIIVGGGINSLEKAKATWNGGADVIVIGNAVETNPELIEEIANYWIVLAK
ncbi:MAG: geranylgeranylglyceryl/heptaprenylglyceryl phosphate synthase [Bacteroidota bacterium]|nr:geranylgeranylglyceryl/heptaprenylglyceryl phosphate synthase [Bacteroidota bacterium]